MDTKSPTLVALIQANISWNIRFMFSTPVFRYPRFSLKRSELSVLIVLVFWPLPSWVRLFDLIDWLWISLSLIAIWSDSSIVWLISDIDGAFSESQVWSESSSSQSSSLSVSESQLFFSNRWGRKFIFLTIGLKEFSILDNLAGDSLMVSTILAFLVGNLFSWWFCGPHVVVSTILIFLAGRLFNWRFCVAT